MPPRIKYSKDDIVEAAFSVVRKSGWQNCTARFIAKELGCSTMPIYSCVTSMADLKNKILQKATELMIQYQRQVKTDIDFLNMGVGYVMFAKEERHLFRLMFKDAFEEKAPGKNPEKSNDTLELFYNYALEALADDLARSNTLADFSKEEKEKILYHSWIYSHGLAVIINNGLHPHMSEPDIIETLRHFGRALIHGVRE